MRRLDSAALTATLAFALATNCAYARISPVSVQWPTAYFAAASSDAFAARVARGLSECLPCLATCSSDRVSVLAEPATERGAVARSCSMSFWPAGLRKLDGRGALRMNPRKWFIEAQNGLGEGGMRVGAAPAGPTGTANPATMTAPRSTERRRMWSHRQRPGPTQPGTRERVLAG